MRMKTFTRMLIVATLLFGSGCAKTDWIDRTLVTETVTGAWTGSMISPDGQPSISQEVRFEVQQQGSRVLGSVRGPGYPGSYFRGSVPLEGTAVGTFVYHSRDQQARAIEQGVRADEQLAAAKRDLQRPYQEKKLTLYLDAARVVAHLASSPSVDQEKMEARFWELYWGELAFVESRTEDEENGGPKPSVERLMVQFCQQYFSPARCRRGGNAGSQGAVKARINVGEAAAIDLARGASKEIRDQWEGIGR